MPQAMVSICTVEPFWPLFVGRETGETKKKNDMKAV